MNFPFKKNTIYDFVEKNFIYLVIGLVVLIVFLFVNFLIAPTWKEIREVNVLELEQQQQRLLDAQEFLADLKVMRDKYSDINYYDIKRLETLLPRGLDTETLALQLEQFGKDAGLTVTSLSVDERIAVTSTAVSRRGSSATTPASSSAGGVEEATVSLTLSGVDTYSSFKDFLEYIDTYAPLMYLSSVDYPIKGDAFSIQLTTYYLSES